MSPEAKRRCEELNNKHFHGSTVMDVVTESYQAGMQDPDANKELLEECEKVAETLLSTRYFLDMSASARLELTRLLSKLKAARGGG